MEDLGQLSDEDLAAERRRLVVAGAAHAQQLTLLEKGDPRRPALVDEKMALDRRLSRVNKEIKRRNSGMPPRPQLTSQVWTSRATLSNWASGKGLDGLTKQEIFALFAMHALISRGDGDRPFEDVAEDAYELADVMLAGPSAPDPDDDGA